MKKYVYTYANIYGLNEQPCEPLNDQELSALENGEINNVLLDSQLIEYQERDLLKVPKIREFLDCFVKTQDATRFIFEPGFDETEICIVAFVGKDGEATFVADIEKSDVEKALKQA